MGHHFCAYSFVDRITAVDPGKHARGRYRIPSGIDRFPSPLISEAIGQLAAWSSMASLDFRLRPVAGLTGRARYVNEVRPGDTLELGVEIASCSDSDVAYDGWAKVDGDTVGVLEHTLGPMLPATDFDDPDALRERFRLLTEDGAAPDCFTGVTPPPLVAREHEPGKRLVADLLVPDADTPYFGDHFPRRPVLPLTLLLTAEIDAALDLARESGHWPATAALTERDIRDVKMRNFVTPGDRLDVEIRLGAPENGVATAALTTRSGGKRVATAKVQISTWENDR